MYLGEWLAGAAEYDECELAFDQDTEDWRDSDVNGNGWTGNRQAIPMVRRRGAVLRSAGHGQYMPLPPAAGTIRITVCAGMRRGERDFTPAGEGEWKNSHDLLRWILFSVPTLAVVNDDKTFSEISGDDIEYSGLLNPNAQEDLEIDTVCGTGEQAPPTARCLFYETATGAPLGMLTREGRTARPEQLLVGTLFSQYAERKLSLSGTVLAKGGSLGKYADAAMEGKVLMMLAETLDARAGESRITVSEFENDHYEEEDE